MSHPLDYASNTARKPKAFRLTPRGVKIIVGLVIAAVAASVLIGRYQHRVRAASLTSLGGPRHWYPDGRDVQLFIAGNANDQTAVMLVHHYSTIDPTRRVMQPGRTYSTRDAVAGLLSTSRLVTRYPADPNLSGLWINGVKRQLSDEMLVVYLSDKVPATDIAIPEAEKEAFLADASKLDPLVFVEKWITPRLPQGK